MKFQVLGIITSLQDMDFDGATARASDVMAPPREALITPRCGSGAGKGGPA